MRKLVLCFSIILVAALTGCSPSPVASGEIVSVTLGNKPVMRAGETGNWSAQTFVKGRIEVYETFAIVTDDNGTRHVAPLERFGVIQFK